MGVTTLQMSIIVFTLGFLSFIFGIIAENKKPASGTPMKGNDVIICKYPSDPTVALGSVSFVFLIASAVAGSLSLFYPYKGKSVPRSILFKSTSLLAYFNVAIFTTILAAIFLIWPTIIEQLHHSRNIHHDLNTDCPTAKTGLIGGGAFFSLNSSLFWLLSLMLVDNAREDYFEDTPHDIQEISYT